MAEAKGLTSPLEGDFTLSIEYPDLVITSCAVVSDQTRFPIPFLRAYGQEGDYFVFEAGRRCPYGPKKFAFLMGADTLNMAKVLDAAVRRSRLGPSTSTSTASSRSQSPSATQRDLSKSNSIDLGVVTHSGRASNAASSISLAAGECRRESGSVKTLTKDRSDSGAPTPERRSSLKPQEQEEERMEFEGIDQEELALQQADAARKMILQAQQDIDAMLADVSL
eukprot:m.43546 g.43546  ORF g.43546 m.43546 type:complete len:223 (-) comp10781_c0_seq2:172-840(-)